MPDGRQRAARNLRLIRGSDAVVPAGAGTGAGVGTAAQLPASRAKVAAALGASLLVHVLVLGLAPHGEPISSPRVEPQPTPVTLLEWTPPPPKRPALALPADPAPQAVAPRTVLPRRTKAAVPREIEAGLPVPAGLPAPVVEPAAAAAEVTAREEPLEVAPAAAVPDAPTGLSQGELRAYARAVRAELVRHRRYPPAALRLGLEGVAKVELAIDRRGSLVGAPRVIQSSGHAVLDEEALRVVEAAAPFVAPPQHGDKDVLVFVIPIDFRLSGD